MATVDEICHALGALRLSQQTKDWIKDCTLNELEIIITRLSDAEENEEGHYPFHSWQFLRRCLYNHRGFEREEDVDPTQLSLLTADPNITLPYDTMRGFDMEERDVPDLFRTPAGAAPAKDIHILVGVGRVRQEEDIPANIPHVRFDHLHPVYATISRHQHEGRRPIVLRILHITAVGDRLTMSRTSGGPYEIEDCLSSSDSSS
jgi:hypothetical protein